MILEPLVFWRGALFMEKKDKNAGFPNFFPGKFLRFSFL